VSGAAPVQAERLAQAARGGRVAHSPFLDDAEAAAVLAALRREGVAASAWGGRPAAARRVVTARPDQVPEARAQLTALYLPGVQDGEVAVAALRAAGLDGGDLGDAVRHADGVSVLATEEAARELPDVVRIGGRETAPEVVGVERATGGSVKTARLVVPSLRADVLGAKAFGASRSWFSKGVAGGKVRVDGHPAGKAATLETGSELWAEGLGRARLLSVEGETKRGNLKVVVEVEKP
jgi:RNA-binding protein YlmH